MASLTQSATILTPKDLDNKAGSYQSDSCLLQQNLHRSGDRMTASFGSGILTYTSLADYAVKSRHPEFSLGQKFEMSNNMYY